VGRIYSYDYGIKLLVLSKYHPKSSQILKLLMFILFISAELVGNPGTSSEYYKESVILNARNIIQFESLSAEDNANMLTASHLEREFAQSESTIMD